MADRTSAEVFSTIFDLLAAEDPDRLKPMAQRLWKMSRKYDFSPYQLGCDDSLRKLDLLRDGPPDPDNPRWGPTLLYGPPDDLDQT